MKINFYLFILQDCQSYARKKNRSSNFNKISLVHIWGMDHLLEKKFGWPTKYWNNFLKTIFIFMLLRFNKIFLRLFFHTQVGSCFNLSFFKLSKNIWHSLIELDLFQDRNITFKILKIQSTGLFFVTHSNTKLTKKGFHPIARMTFKLLNPLKIKSQIEVGQICLSLIHTLTVLYCRLVCLIFFHLLLTHDFRIVNQEIQEILQHIDFTLGEWIFSQNWTNFCAYISAILCTSWIHTL